MLEFPGMPLQITYVLFQVGRAPALRWAENAACPLLFRPLPSKMPRGLSMREAPSRAGGYKINRNGGLAGSPWGLTN